MITSIVLIGFTSAFAQVGSTSPRNAPMINMSLLRSGIPLVGGNSKNTLGTIQLNLGGLSAIPGGTIGAIVTCPTAGIAAAMPTTTLDASNAIGTTGLLPPQLLPGATPPAIPSFGTSIMTGACDPATAAQDAAESSGNNIAAPIPGLATITGPAFSDATIPTAATEAGAAGMSPEIVVPTPDSSAAP